MQRIVTLENYQTFELPTGEYTVRSISDDDIELMGQNCGVQPLRLSYGQTCQLDELSLTYMERFEDCAHIKVDSMRRFVTAEMAVGELDGLDELVLGSVLVVSLV